MVSKDLTPLGHHLKNAFVQENHGAMALIDRWCPSALLVLLSLSSPALALDGQQGKMFAPKVAPLSTPHVGAGPKIAVVPTTLPLPRPGASPSLKGVIDLYRQGNIALGDALSAKLPDAPARLASQWAAIALQPRMMGSARLMDFFGAHPHWPARRWLELQIEAALYLTKPALLAGKQYFDAHPPRSPLGTMALASIYLNTGDKDAAAKLLRPLWRRQKLTGWQERQFIAHFKDLINASDDDRRAERLTLEGDYDAALRAAARDDKNEIALVQTAAALIRHQVAGGLIDKLPAAKRNNPLLRYGKASTLFQEGKLDQAAAFMLGAPKDPARLLAPDQWWRLRRQMARALLDRQQTSLAYQLCATSPAESNRERVDTEFHAGWIALRFLNEPKLAAQHFTTLERIAKTPMSYARGAYWLGRSMDAAGHANLAQDDYARAARQPNFYFGQMAAARLTAPLPPVVQVPQKMGMKPSRVVKLAKAFFKAGAPELAKKLLLADARTADSAGLARLADYVRQRRDPTLATKIGKIADRRGLSQGTLAFPAHGMPDFVPLADRASKPLLYAIARQESTFQPQLISRAGARGLMQLMVATAKRTASTEKVPFDLNRLTSDPAYNLQLAAAFLGLLEHEQRGSLARTLAAYNAGGSRVSQWIAAHGDPANPAVDPVDWVEAIPIDETRDYVEHVMANVGVYRRLFGSAHPISAEIGASPETSQR